MTAFKPGHHIPGKSGTSRFHPTQPFAAVVAKGSFAPKDETALAVISGRTRGLGSSGKQASCLDIEGPRTSPKTGAPNDRQGHQYVTTATDRGHGDQPAQPQDSLPVYPPRQ